MRGRPDRRPMDGLEPGVPFWAFFTLLLEFLPSDEFGRESSSASDSRSLDSPERLDELPAVAGTGSCFGGVEFRGFVPDDLLRISAFVDIAQPRIANSMTGATNQALTDCRGISVLHFLKCKVSQRSAL